MDGARSVDILEVVNLIMGIRLVGLVPDNEIRIIRLYTFTMIIHQAR